MLYYDWFLVEGVKWKILWDDSLRRKLGQGTIFEYDYGSNEDIVKVNLIGSKGINPYGSLIEAANGKFYGMTNHGGSSMEE